MNQHIDSSKQFGGEWMEVPAGGAGAYGRQSQTLCLARGLVSVSTPVGF